MLGRLALLTGLSKYERIRLWCPGGESAKNRCNQSLRGVPMYQPEQESFLPPHRTDNNRPDDGPEVLPQDILGRIALGLLCATYLPFSALCLYDLTPKMQLPAPTWQVWLLRATMWEFMFVLMAVAVLGLMWAFFKPEWVRPFARRYGRRLALLSAL